MIKEIAKSDCKKVSYFFFNSLRYMALTELIILLLRALSIVPKFSFIHVPSSCWSCSWYWWAVVVFVVTMRYTPESVGLIHSVVERVVYSAGFIMMLIFPWWPPPFVFGRFTVLVYRRCIILSMAS